MACLFLPGLAKAQPALNDAQPFPQCITKAARKKSYFVVVYLAVTLGVPVKMGPCSTENFAEASAVQLFLFGFKSSPAVFANFNTAA